MFRLLQQRKKRTSFKICDFRCVFFSLWSSWLTNFNSIRSMFALRKYEQSRRCVVIFSLERVSQLQPFQCMANDNVPTQWQHLILFFIESLANRVICGNSMSINVIIRSFCFMVNSIIFLKEKKKCHRPFKSHKCQCDVFHLYIEGIDVNAFINSNAIAVADLMIYAIFHAN